jgi:hypothetical protein
MHRIALVAAVLLACLLPAGVAHAQFGAPTAPQQLTQPPPAPAQDNDVDDGGLSALQIVLIIGGAVAVLALIAFVIVRDARRAAPVEDHPRRDGPGKSSGGPAKNASMSEIRARERQQAKRQKAKAKQVRAQRKRNRPR